MKLLISTFFFLISFQIHANVYDYNYIDKKVSNYPAFNNAETLTIRITNDFNTDTEKARAIYTWIALNIKYNDAYNSIYNNNIYNFYYTDYQKNRSLKKKEIKIIEYVLNSKIANCYGYSLLYKSLCNKLNIESKIIYGITKSNIKDIGIDRVIKDHAWNIVKINNKWELIDVTWSAGYQDMRTKKFIKSFNDFYFFTSPNEFINHHFPAKEKWQLITEPVKKKEFFSTPIFYSDYFNSDLKISNKHNGIIYITKNTKTITLYFDEIPKEPILNYIFENDLKAKKLSLKKSKNNTYQVTLKIKDNTAKNLTIFSEGEASIGFKIERLNNNL